MISFTLLKSLTLVLVILLLNILISKNFLNKYLFSSIKLLENKMFINLGYRYSFKDLYYKLHITDNFTLFKKLLIRYVQLQVKNLTMSVKSIQKAFFVVYDAYLEKGFFHFFETFGYNHCDFERYYHFRNNYDYFNQHAFDHYYMYYFSWKNLDLYISSYFFFFPQFAKYFNGRYIVDFEFIKDYKNKLYTPNNNYFIYLLPLYTQFKSVFLILIFVFLIFINLILYFYINLLKQFAIWLMIGFLFFWLISGFNFFLKRSLFGKLTSALTRFWKRANTYFWLVEGFLFLLFFYYYLNSSQEPVYMYDYSSLNQSYLPNLLTTYCNSFLLIIIIIYLYFWLLSLSAFTNQQNIIHCFLITCIFMYIYVVESYQFYYVLTFFFENIWTYNSELNIWNLEFESPRLRVKQQYLILALIAKYWHFMFIFLSWVFFILKFFEQKRAYYTHTGFNIQNMIILFWLNFLFIIQWGKWVGRRFFDSVYYWFFTDSNFHFLKYLFLEINVFKGAVKHIV